MARPLNYSKWDHIEISDDEDDTHPNIDTPSLFKWRHEARVKREEELEAKKKATEDEKRKKEQEIDALKKKMASTKLSESELAIIQKGLSELEKDAAEVTDRQKSVIAEEQKQPWNVDTLSQDGFSKSIINKPVPRTNEHLTEEQREEKMRNFVKAHKKEIEEFGWLKKYEDSKAYMVDRTYLACEETANYLVIHCLNLELEEKCSAMEQVAHQCICVQYLLELAKQLDVDPRSCISSFFSKIAIADQEYRKAFEDELEAFKTRIRNRAIEKLKEQIEEAKQEEEIERQNRLGPGGLDPVEVFESLPAILQECFESQDIGKLQEAIGTLPVEEARHHMKRCVDSGLWKPATDDPGTNPEDGFRKRDNDDDEEENEYAEITPKTDED